MKAVRFHAYGGSEVLKIEEIDKPVPGPGQVRIRVRAAAVNPIDWKLRAGYMHAMMPLAFPAGSGCEASGVIDAVGDGVPADLLGSSVFGKGNATMAEYAILDEWAAKPDALTFEEVAGLSVAAETAARIIDQVGVKPGETLLVSGAAGGVGSAALQLARVAGIRTIGTASEPKHDYLRSLGAIPTTYGPGLSQRVAELAPAGVHAALDVVDSGMIPELVAITGSPSKVVSISDLTAPQYGAKTSFEPLDKDGATKVLEQVAALCVAGAFTLPVAQTFQLQDLAAAHDLNAQGHVTGRLVVTFG